MRDDNNSNNRDSGPRKPTSRFPIGTLMAFAIPTVAVLFAVAFAICRMGIGFYNPYTPPGFAGYVTKGAIIGSTRFETVQYGPTSPGAGWLLHVKNLPITVRAFNEDFSGNQGILSADGTRIDFSVEFQIRIRSGIDKKTSKDYVQEFVDTLTTIKPGDSGEKIISDTYKSNLEMTLRGYVLTALDAHAGTEIQDAMPAIRDTVFDEAQKFTADMPVEVVNVSIGRIHYPDSITDQNKKNRISLALRDQEAVKVELQRMDAMMDVITAFGVKAANVIIKRSITPCWLQYQALMALQASINSPTQTTIMIPVGPMGVPVVDGTKSCSDVKSTPADTTSSTLLTDIPGFVLPAELRNVDLSPVKSNPLTTPDLKLPGAPK